MCSPPPHSRAGSVEQAQQSLLGKQASLLLTEAMPAFIYCAWIWRLCWQCSVLMWSFDAENIHGFVISLQQTMLSKSHFLLAKTALLTLDSASQGGSLWLYWRSK